MSVNLYRIKVRKKPSPTELEVVVSVIYDRILDVEKIYKRKVYSLLEMLGNIGGLYEGLFIIIGFIVNFYNATMLELSLGKSLFKFHKTPVKTT